MGFHRYDDRQDRLRLSRLMYIIADIVGWSRGLPWPKEGNPAPKIPVTPRASVAEPDISLPQGLSPEDLIDTYTKTVLARTMDERIWALNRQGKVPIAASSQGHEAAEIGSLLAAQKDGRTFLFPYYRDLALKMTAGLTATQVMLSFMGKVRPVQQRPPVPLQGADLPRNIIQISNVVGAGLTQSTGYAFACKMLGDDTVVLCYFGDGASSQGETHEAMNFAGVHSLPVVYICENNHYAISVPHAARWPWTTWPLARPATAFPE